MRLNPGAAPIRVALSLLLARGWRLVPALVLLRVGERWLLFATAVAVTSYGSAIALASFAALAATLSARSLVRHALVAEVRRRASEVFVKALFARGMASSEDERTRGKGDEVAVFEGHYAVESLAAEQLPLLAGDLIAAVTLLPQLAEFPPRLLGYAVASALAAWAVSMAARRLANRAEARIWEAYASVARSLRGAALGARELVAQGRAKRFEAVAAARAQAWADTAEREGRLLSASVRAPAIVAIATFGALYAVDPQARQSWSTTPPATIAAFIAVVPAWLGWMQALPGVWHAAALFAPMARFVAEAAKAPVATRADHVAGELAIEHGALSFDDVSFQYPGGRELFRGLSFDVRAGALVAIRGENGVGKSTVLAISAGLRRPSAGTIRLCGHDPFALDASEIESLRQRIAFVPQRPFMADDASVAEAMRIVASDATDDALLEALARVGVLPSLGERPLDANVETLSSGQRQRVAIARAVANSPLVLLLDEPDQNLDAAGVRALKTLMLELASTRLVIFAAHDLELVEVADVIVHLERERAPVVARKRKAPRSPGLDFTAREAAS